MTQRRTRTDQFDRGSVHAFPRATPAVDETTALDLVYQAADIFRGLQDRARETELRARSLCSAASEQVRTAEARAEASEQAYRDLVVAVDQKLRDVSEALEQAQARMAAEMDKRAAAELRTERAEADAREAKRALSAVEEAIRTRLLDITPSERLAAAA